MLRRLLPTPRAIEQLALRESDPAHVHEFEPITAGPFVAVAVVIAVGIVAAALTPFRLLGALLRKDEA
jgi:hypothetical protein